MSITTDVQQLYIGYLGRAADKEGLAYWVDEITTGVLTMEQLRSNLVNEQPEYMDIYGQLTRSQTVDTIYRNLFERAPEAEGFAYWVSGGGSTVPADQLIVAFLNAASPADQLVVDNKTTVAMAYTDTLGGADTFNIDQAHLIIDDVTGAPDTVADALAAIAAGGGSPAESLTLTQLADNLVGTASDDVFTAPVTQNQTGSGALANTFETGDVLVGGAGRDILRAKLIDTGTIGDNVQGAAISATTTGIEEVYLTAITPQADNANNTTTVSTVDAHGMSGVTQWWTDQSRSNIRIEDIQSTPDNTTFGMRLTDPAVGFDAYFNPLFLTGDASTTASAFNFTIRENANFAVELANITVTGIRFNYEGVNYNLTSADMEAADTWDALLLAVEAELAADPALVDFTVTQLGSGQFIVQDPNSGIFDITGGVVASISSVTEEKDESLGLPVAIEGPTITDLVLDGAGSGSRGGAVNIAAMSGDRGIEVMNVLVDRSSHITSLRSENDPSNVNSFSQEQQLEEVYLTHLAGGAKGKMQLGSRTVDQQGVSTTTDDRLQTNGLLDVRVFDATGFTSELKLGAALTANIFDKYLLGVAEPVQFSYLLGDGGSNLNLAVNNLVAGDPDFLLEIIGGAQADRINLTGLAVKQQTTIDGGNNTVIDTLELNTSTGWAADVNGADIVAPAVTDLTAAETSFAGVTNIEKLVIAGNNNTTHNLVAAGLGDVDDIFIATGNVNTRLVNLNATEQSVVVTGKNQTLGAGNNNNNQTFGLVRFTDTTGAILDLELANTARVSGVLTVNTLTIDNQVGNVNDVRTLNIDSAGVRDTANVITTLNGNRVNTFNLEGTQDLTITDLASAANSVAAAAASRDNLLVDGSALGTFDDNGDLVAAANLYLGVTGGVITAVDAALGTNRTVKLIGTEGTADILNIRDGVTTTNATTISAFETIRFGEDAPINVPTNFNATNVSDVTLYDLVDSTATINLFNLRSTENVQINAVNTDGTTVGNDVTLSAANATTGSQINVDFVSDEATAVLAVSFWGAGGANLNVRDFSTISLDMGGTANEAYAYNFNLNTLPSTTAPLTVKARTLEITGGRYETGFNFVDSLTLNELDTALTKVDFSDYKGNFFTQGWNSTQGTNADVVVNEFGFLFDVGGDNTLFSVPPTVGGPASAETLEFDFTTGAYAGLAIGDSIVITWAGGEYVFTNNTTALLAAADLDNAIIADAANAPSAFNIVVGAAVNSVLLTSTAFGNMPDPTDAPGTGYIKEVTAAGVVTDLIGAATATVTASVDGDLAATNVIGAEFVTAQSEFLTKFIFTKDAYAAGVVWQVDNFQAFDGVANVTLQNQSQLDMRQLGVDSSTKITIWDDATLLADILASATGGQEYANIEGVANFAATALNATLTDAVADTYITSNDGLDFTIVLTGVDRSYLGNENIVGIA